MRNPEFAAAPGSAKTWRRWLPRRLEQQLMLLATACLLAFNLSYGVYTAQRQADQAHALLATQMAALAQNLATIHARFLLTDDLVGIEAIMLQTAPVPGLVSLEVTDVTGRPLSDVVNQDGHWAPRFRADKLAVPSVYAALTRPEPVDGASASGVDDSSAHPGAGWQMAAWHPIMAGAPVGWVRVSYHLDTVKHIALGLWMQALLVCVLSIGVSLGLLMLLLRRPMRALAAATQFAARLDHALDERLEVSNDFAELEALGQALNLVAARLSKQHKDLGNQQFALDQHAIVSITDLNGDIVYANDRFCEISGYSRLELIGNSHRLLNSNHHPAEFFTELWHTISSGQVWHGEIQNLRKGGEPYWVDVTIAPLMGADGLPQQYIAIRTDISASKNTERELKRERLALANIIDGTNVGTWEWNIETGEVVCNQRWAEMIGHGMEEFSRITIESWNSRVHPDDLKAMWRALQLHFDGALPAYDCEFRIQHKAGHWVWVLSRGKLFKRTPDGRPLWMAGTQMDITERKQAEVALHDSRSFLDKAERIGGIGGWALDFATNVLKWTDQARRIHEAEPDYQPTAQEVRSRYPGEARTALERALQLARTSGESYDMELPLVTRKGRQIWVRLIGTAEFEDGKPARLMGAIQDISARREMELKLRRSNELVSSVIESLPCGLSVFDAEQNLILANTEFRRLLKLPDALFDQRLPRFEDLVRLGAEHGNLDPGNVPAYVQTIVAEMRKLAAPQQIEIAWADGMSLELRRAPMPGGGFVTTYSDVSARKRAEAEVQRSSKLLRGAIDAIDEAFVLFDPDDRLVFCNDKYREVYAEVAHLMVPGVTFEELVRAGVNSGNYLESVGRSEEWLAERVASHRSGNSKLTQRHVSGRTFRIVERKMPDGHLVGFRIDITELVRTTDAAKAASQAKSQFLANMSHELRTPMNTILGMLTLLRKTELTPRQADYALKSEGAARALLSLLNEILDFSKIEAGKMLLDVQAFRIDQLMRDLSVILSTDVSRKRVDVLFDIDPALPRHLMGDAMRLRQVLINLCGNALKFTEMGEVLVSLKVVARAASAVTVEIAVRDTGIGIAPENQARIFSGFTQAEASTTRRFGGTGLGLAISQRLIALMGGTLELDSALGQGSRFHFCITLPLAPEAIDDMRRLASPAAPVRALFVDDNRTAREVFMRMGQSFGWTVDAADGGETALALLAQNAAAGTSFEVVFVDWYMPGLDGWQTVQRIHDLALPGPRPMLVMVTVNGLDMLAQRSAAEQALLDGFLVKPITGSMLFDAFVDARAGHANAQAHPSQAAAGAASQRLAGMRLLVVEDNRNNQQVARELLQAEGAIVQIANHGQEAVDAVSATTPPFDLVLMDLQMPVLDGFAATRAIRQDLKQLKLPIVAMTANAMASDREACLAAGMNDHVGKPFDLDHLVAVLRRHAHWQEVAQDQNAAAAATLSAAVVQAAATAGVDIDGALGRMGGRRAVYLGTLRTVTRNLAAMLAQLQAHAAQREVASAARLLHTLKGLAATLGATALSDEAARAEKQLAGEAARNDLAYAGDRVCAAILAASPGLQALLQALQAENLGTPGPRAQDAVDFDLHALQDSLRLMAAQLRNADMAATETMEQLQQQFGEPLPEPLQPLGEAMGALDFERALRLCQELIDHGAQTTPTMDSRRPPAA